MWLDQTYRRVLISLSEVTVIKPLCFNGGLFSEDLERDGAAVEVFHGERVVVWAAGVFRQVDDREPEGMDGGEWCELFCGEVEEKSNVKDRQQD